MFNGKTIGVEKFWLFEGQTAYVPYDIHKNDQPLTIEIFPMTPFRSSTYGLKSFSQVMETFKREGVKRDFSGTRSGILTYVVPKSGIFKIGGAWSLELGAWSLELGLTRKWIKDKKRLYPHVWSLFWRSACRGFSCGEK